MPEVADLEWERAMREYRERAELLWRVEAIEAALGLKRAPSLSLVPTGE